MRAGGIAGMSTCPWENAEWPIIPPFRQTADGYLLLRWTAEARLFPAGSFHSTAPMKSELLALPMGRVFRARGRLMVNGSILQPGRMTFTSGGTAFLREIQSNSPLAQRLRKE